MNAEAYWNKERGRNGRIPVGLVQNYESKAAAMMEDEAFIRFVVVFCFRIKLR